MKPSVTAPRDARERPVATPSRRLNLLPRPSNPVTTVKDDVTRTPFGALPCDASDTQLVSRCLAGDDAAWECLISRYKRLIYSVPVKYGATPDVAADIFQAVCVDLVAELPKLRNPEALKGWLMRVTQHKCLRWKTGHRRQAGWTSVDEDESVAIDDTPTAPQVMESVEREAAVRAAVDTLPAKQRELVTMLFFTTPALPYTEVAQRLGLATGSIGFIRGRCLRKIEKALKQAGF